MKTLRVLFWDHLSHDVAALQDIHKENDVILLCELHEEAVHVKHHKKKLVFLFSAMRHFAKELKDRGFTVRHVPLDDPKNTGSMAKEVRRAVQDLGPDQIVTTFPGDYRSWMGAEKWAEETGVPVKILEDDRFLCPRQDFAKWAQGRKVLRMEYFYRDMRERHQILMDPQGPKGGQWNFDKDNRKPPGKNMTIPKTYEAKPDAVTREVMDMVEKHFNDHFGAIEPFHLAVTRDQALQALDQFIHQRLHSFGDYQDAMCQGEPWMFHSHLSFYMNCGLLNARECIVAAENAHEEGLAPLNAVEGFIRQILGWREYVRGIYWLKMPDYVHVNALNAQRPLPDFYWTGETKMNCMHQCITETKDNAYAHHIQRLMVLGNFALLTGISPKEVNEWYWIVYADAYEWVELPNVSGMILFADGGYLASKPYAAGGSYIHKMSNYCDGCAYDVREKNGPKACPFNYLYWDFLARNRRHFASNQRMAMMYRTYDRMSQDKKEAITRDAMAFLETI